MHNKKCLPAQLIVVLFFFFQAQCDRLEINLIIQDFLMSNFSAKKHLKQDNHTSLSDQEIAGFIIEFFKKNMHLNFSLSYQLIRDMSLVKNQSGMQSNIFTIISSLAPTKTVAGKTTLGLFLLNPTSDTGVLFERQKIIKGLKDDKKNNVQQLIYHISEMQNHERYLVLLTSQKKLLSTTEEKLLFSKLPVLGNQINKNRILYNIMSIAPIFSQAAIIPIACYSLCVYLAHLLINTTDQKVANLINRLVEKEGKNREEVINNYLQLIKSMSKEELQEKLRSMTSYVVQTKGSLNDFELFGIFGGMPIQEQEKILKKTKHTIQEDIDFVASNYNAIIERTNGKAKKAIGSILGLPSLLLSGQYIKQLKIICSKMRELRIYLIHAAHYLSHFDKIVSIMQTIPDVEKSSLLKEFTKINNDGELKKLRSFLNSHAFKNEKNWYDIGTVFVTFQEFLQQEKIISESILAIGQLDMYLGLVHLMQRYGTENKNSFFCFAEYVQYEQFPIIEAKNFWNPLILSHKAIHSIIPNSILLGSKEKQNAIITGPNTCGKTTIMFAILLNAIFAQTLGIAAAEKFSFTPFQEFYATVSVTSNDAIGDSKFNAEVREAMKILSFLQQADEKNYFVLNIQDEIFTGTNPQDGEEAAYQFLEKIGQYQNSINLIATHYNRLTTLDNFYALYKINASIKKDQTINKPFTIDKGVSDLNIALIILKEADFDRNI